MWKPDFWRREGLQSGALWRRQNAVFTVSNYLIPFRNCAVIMPRHFLWLHGDRRGGIVGRPLFDAVLCRCYKLSMYVVTHSGLSACWELKQDRFDCKLQGHLAHGVHLPALCCHDRTWRHTFRYIIRQTACMVATNNSKEEAVACFLHLLQAFQRGVRNPHDVALQGRMHVTYWSNTMGLH
jgi:hypothetical protein